MKKRYILMSIIYDKKYEGFVKYYYKLFDNYFDLQKHLQNFWYIKKNKYVVFEETEITKDYSINDVKYFG